MWVPASNSSKDSESFPTIWEGPLISCWRMDVQVIGGPEVGSVAGRTDTQGYGVALTPSLGAQVPWYPMESQGINVRVLRQLEGQGMLYTSYHITDLIQEIYWGRAWNSTSECGREREKEKENHNYIDFMKDMQIMVPAEICHIWNLVMTWLLTLICLRWGGGAPGSGIRGILNLPTIASLLMAETQHVTNANVN